VIYGVEVTTFQASDSPLDIYNLKFSLLENSLDVVQTVYEYSDSLSLDFDEHSGTYQQSVLAVADNRILDSKKNDLTLRGVIWPGYFKAEVMLLTLLPKVYLVPGMEYRFSSVVRCRIVSKVWDELVEVESLQQVYDPDNIVGGGNATTHVARYIDRINKTWDICWYGDWVGEYVPGSRASPHLRIHLIPDWRTMTQAPFGTTHAIWSWSLRIQRAKVDVPSIVLLPRPPSPVL